MKKVLPLAMVLLCCTLFFSSCSTASGGNGDSGSPAAGPTGLPSPQDLPLVDAQLGSHSVRLMIARTEAQKRTGLMFVTNLPPNQGMVFVYASDQKVSFWMKNTLIPLDLIMLSSDLQITEFIPDMRPGYGVPEYELIHYRSTRPARYTIELPAGSISRLNLAIGDRLTIPLAYLSAE